MCGILAHGQVDFVAAPLVGQDAQEMPVRPTAVGEAVAQMEDAQ